MTTDPLLLQTASTIINRMLSESSWFDVCAVTKAADLLGVYKQSPQFEGLRKYHCVNWRDMPAELRTRVLAELAQAFGEYAPRIRLSGEAAREAARQAWSPRAYPAVVVEPERPRRLFPRLFKS